VADLTTVHVLLHGEGRAVFGNAGYQGVEKREENANTNVAWHLAMRFGQRRALAESNLHRLLDQVGHRKAHARAKGEHIFRVI
jgi:IS5 family transposase